MEKFSIICPCCEAALTVDAQTGAILAHEEKAKKFGSFEDLKAISTGKRKCAKTSSHRKEKRKKDRQRILEEKFQEALKRADTDSDKPFKNPVDLD